MYKCIRCTDDVALLAEAEKHIKKMIDDGHAGKVLGGEGAGSNTRKTKIMKFRKRGGRWKINWMWKKNIIEEVRKFRCMVKFKRK